VQRIIVGGVAGGVIALALLIGGARWIGQQAAPGVVPLPDNGCWLDMCPFQMPVDAIPGVLMAAPGVVPGSVESAGNDYATGYPQATAYTYQPPRAAPRALVLLSGDREQLVIERDWRSSAAIMHLGDLIAAFGPPDSLNWDGVNTLFLQYEGRQVSAGVYPNYLRFVYHAVQLTPGDFVVLFLVRNPDIPPGSGMVYSRASLPWRGFTWYHLLDD